MMIYLDVDLLKLILMDLRKGVEGNRSPNFSMYVNYAVFT